MPLHGHCGMTGWLQPTQRRHRTQRRLTSLCLGHYKAPEQIVLVLPWSLQWDTVKSVVKSVAGLQGRKFKARRGLRGHKAWALGAQKAGQ